MKRSSRTNNHVVGASERQTKFSSSKPLADGQYSVLLLALVTFLWNMISQIIMSNCLLMIPKNPTVPSRLETFSGPSLYSKYVRPNFLLITAKCYWNVQLIFLGRHL